jgi:hypothetical protein
MEKTVSRVTQVITVTFVTSPMGNAAKVDHTVARVTFIDSLVLTYKCKVYFIRNMVVE